MVKQWQDLFWGGRRSGTLFNKNPDFVGISKAYGIPAHRTGLKEEVQPLIEKALKHKGPILLEFVLDENAYVYPMIPAGKGFEDIMEGGEE